MHYLGGKSRIGKEVAFKVTSLAKGRPIYEPFCGALWVTRYLQPTLASDNNSNLIALYDAIRAGYELPDSIDEAEYRDLQEASLEGENSPLITFVGFACSWGGKWFAGYARGNVRNYCLENKYALIDKLFDCRTIPIRCLNYTQLDVKDSVIYCDPPYRGTEGYGIPFDTSRFWKWADAMSLVNTVVVSEYIAPSSWKSIWSKLGYTMSSTDTKSSVEQLWIKG